MNGVSGYENQLITFFDGQGVFWVALAIALGVGAMHAVAPGHGKSITAAYLVGTRGRYRDALRLGVIVAVMHTVSVLMLALAWVGLSGVAGFGTEAVTAWMQVLAGLVVIGVGTHLTYRHLRGRSHSHPSSRGHGHGHDHDHGHEHEHEHGHDHGSDPDRDRDREQSQGQNLDRDQGQDQDSNRGHDQGRDQSHENPSGHVHPHEPGHHHGSHPDGEEQTDPWSRRGLVALALSGGLLPSPSAFIVLVSGLLTGRALDAVVLVVAFGAGMALTLTGVGVVTIRGYALLRLRTRGWSAASAASAVVAWTPAVAGVAVAVSGCLYLLAAITTLAT